MYRTTPAYLHDPTDEHRADGIVAAVEQARSKAKDELAEGKPAQGDAGSATGSLGGRTVLWAEDEHDGGCGQQGADQVGPPIPSARRAGTEGEGTEEDGCGDSRIATGRQRGVRTILPSQSGIGPRSSPTSHPLTGS